MKLTAKQELFAQEVAKGSSQAEAYRTAYNTSNMKADTIVEKACIEAGKDNVRARIEELKAKIEEKAIEKIVYGITEHFNELEELRQLALVPRGDNGNIELNSAIKATELKGKLFTLYRDKLDMTVSDFNMFIGRVKNKQTNLDEA